MNCRNLDYDLGGSLHFNAYNLRIDMSAIGFSGLFRNTHGGSIFSISRRSDDINSTTEGHLFVAAAAISKNSRSLSSGTFTNNTSTSSNTQIASLTSAIDSAKVVSKPRYSKAATSKRANSGSRSKTNAFRIFSPANLRRRTNQQLAIVRADAKLSRDQWDNVLSIPFWPLSGASVSSPYWPASISLF